MPLSYKSARNLSLQFDKIKVIPGESPLVKICFRCKGDECVFYYALRTTSEIWADVKTLLAEMKYLGIPTLEIISLLQNRKRFRNWDLLDKFEQLEVCRRAQFVRKAFILLNGPTEFALQRVLNAPNFLIKEIESPKSKRFDYHKKLSFLSK